MEEAEGRGEGNDSSPRKGGDDLDKHCDYGDFGDFLRALSYRWSWPTPESQL